MTFQSAVKATHDVCKAYCGGLKALGNYSSKVHCNDSRRLTGSINVEEALREDKPNSPLWDYGIGYRYGKHGSEKAIWIEIHPASSGHIRDVLKKFKWLRGWLKSRAPRLDALTHGDFHWIATGKIAITAHSPQAKQLAKQGLQGPTRSLSLDE